MIKIIISICIFCFSIIDSSDSISSDLFGEPEPYKKVISKQEKDSYLISLREQISNDMELINKSIKVLLNLFKNLDFVKTLENFKSLEQDCIDLKKQTNELKNPSSIHQYLKNIDKKLKSFNINKIEFNKIKENFELISVSTLTNIKKIETDIKQIEQKLYLLKNQYKNIISTKNINSLNSLIQEFFYDYKILSNNIELYKKYSKNIDFDSNIIEKYQENFSNLNLIKKYNQDFNAIVELQNNIEEFINSFADKVFDNKKNEYLTLIQEIIPLVNRIKLLLQNKPETFDKLQVKDSSICNSVPVQYFTENKVNIIDVENKKFKEISDNNKQINYNYTKDSTKESTKSNVEQVKSNVLKSDGLIKQKKIAPEQQDLQTVVINAINDFDKKHDRIIKDLQELQHQEEKDNYIIITWSQKEARVQKLIDNIKEQTNYFLKTYASINIQQNDQSVIDQLFIKQLQYFAKIENVIGLDEHDLLAQQFINEQNIISKELFFKKILKSYDLEKKWNEEFLEKIKNLNFDDPSLIKTISDQSFLFEEQCLKFIAFEKCEQDKLDDLIRQRQKEKIDERELLQRQNIIKYEIQKLEQLFVEISKLLENQEQKNDDLIQILSKEKQFFEQLLIEQISMQEQTNNFFDIEINFNSTTNQLIKNSEQFIEKPKSNEHEEQIDTIQRDDFKTDINDINSLLEDISKTSRQENITLLPISEKQHNENNELILTRSQKKEQKRKTKEEKLNQKNNMIKILDTI